MGNQWLRFGMMGAVGFASAMHPADSGRNQETEEAKR
ncbi:MAG: hypothetical protein QOC89_3363 [Paraburkholderia sp.]|nr:hypothetical protein [Paraburkholderia sp.]